MIAFLTLFVFECFTQAWCDERLESLLKAFQSIDALVVFRHTLQQCQTVGFTVKPRRLLNISSIHSFIHLFVSVVACRTTQERARHDAMQ
jgi:hypothetical protein